jgi:hypothetical protein
MRAPGVLRSDGQSFRRADWGVHTRAATLMAHALVGSGVYALHAFTALFGSSAMRL